ncbi:uncharacterized protein N0V89_012055 [Didymosphaeria variabile]|uniref:Uncharacterized protein n=1 Tax=Didymosphaeria variabile TaxID=1932322 RepID=A0A9W9C6B8_9PLEO|nr:uncharacterized protein N0V89_012055 [Didymosphaeria variabile]KAJ4345919.1 hypothetical protein N0V89_012055 [Didymosphaeria variabile]
MDADANRSQSSLESMIERLLQDNQRLGKRLRNLEDTFDAMSIVTRDMDNSSLAPEADNATITSSRPSASNRVSILEAVKVRFAFDEDLQSSRVYRTMQNRNCDHSMVSSVIRTQTWSIFSGLSLADISVISVIALPLYPEDVRGHSEYYQFGQTESAEITATWTHAQVIVEAGTSGENKKTLPGHKESSSMVSTPTSLYPLVLPEIPMTVLELDPPFELENEEQGSTPVKSPGVHDKTLQRLEGPPNHSLGIPEEDASSSKATGTEAGLSGESLSPSGDARDALLDDGYESLPDGDYYCKGCGEILEEGKAYELGE